MDDAELFELLIACRDDQSGREYPAGSQVSDADFPIEVLEHWVAVGIARRVTDIRRASKGRKGSDGKG